MQSNINNSVIRELLTEAQQDGVQKLVVGAVIQSDKKFLLLEREPTDFMGGLVELPSGTVDADEELLPALVREVQEETGLKVITILKYLGSFDYKSGSGKKTRQFNFLVEAATGDVKLNPIEHQAYHFIESTDEKFSTFNISDEVKKILMIAQKQLSRDARSRN